MRVVSVRSTDTRALYALDRILEVKHKMRKRLFIALASVGAFFAIAGPALASNTSPIAMGYCGPAYTSKAAMMSWYQSHPVQRARAEVWVRSHAGYYHIQNDQSFIAWLSMPNIKYKAAPVGYTLQANTYCDGAGNVRPYHGRLSVSKLPMLWWCTNAKGSGSGCTPIAKYYCRNFVMGRKVFPTPKVVKPKPKVVTPPKQTVVCTFNGVPQYVQPPNTTINAQGQCVVQTNNCPVSGQVHDANGNCVNQSNAAEQNCKAAGGTYNNNTGLCTIIQVNGNCSNIIVINGSGNTVSNTQGGNCNNTTTTPSPTFTCTGLSLSVSNLSATATIGVATTGGAAFKSATISWGDNQSTTDGLTQSHTYAAGGTFGVSAVVTFSLPNSTTATANCSASVTLSTPPPVVSPPTVTVNFVQEIDASDGSITYTARVCGSVKAVNGDSLSVSFKANYGKFDNSNLPTMTANGTDQQVCNTYTSPTEAGVKDQITINVLDSTTKLSASNVSNLFDIVKAVSSP
jgi:hypothetical protein